MRVNGADVFCVCLFFKKEKKRRKLSSQFSDLKSETRAWSFFQVFQGQQTDVKYQSKVNRIVQCSNEMQGI